MRLAIALALPISVFARSNVLDTVTATTRVARALNERNLQPGEDALDADQVFAASGCAYAAQQSLERELHTAGVASPREAGSRERAARDGTFGPVLWLRSLRGRSDWVGHPGQRAVTAARYLAMALRVRNEHQRFLTFLQAHPPLRACVQRDPGLQERHLHSFINRHWHHDMRLGALQHHYNFVLDRFPAALFDAIYVRGRATLGELALKDGSALLLHLGPPRRKDCEGELRIELCDARGRVLHHLALTIIDDHSTLAIGGLHGPDDQYACEQTAELTRNMHGLCPRQLLLDLAYALAGQCGIRRMLAVGDAALPSQQPCEAGVDAFWREHGGVDAGEAGFELPAVRHHHAEVEVTDRHRTMFQWRAELRWQAVQLLCKGLHQVPWWSSAAAAQGQVESCASLPGDLREASWTS